MTVTSGRALSSLWGYGLAIVSVLLAFLARLGLNQIVGSNFPFSTFLIAVLGMSWFCGLRPALLALGLSLAVLFWYVLPESQSFSISADSRLPAILIFLTTGGIGIGAIDSLRRARRRIEIEVAYRSQALEQLSKSEADLRSMIELNPQVPWIADADGTICDFSERWLGLTGLTREQAMTEGAVRLPHPDDLSYMTQAWTQSIRTGGPLDIEHRIRLADGTYHWMRSRAFPRRDESGRILRWYGTTEDIHDRKLTQIALEESHRQFQDLSDAIPQIAFVSDADGVLLSLNRRWTEYTGLDLEQSRNEALLASVIHPEDIPRMVEGWSRSKALGCDFEEQIRFRCAADGSYRWFLSRCVPVKDREGKVVRWFGTSTDIDDQKRVEEELRENSATMRAFYDNSPFCMGVVEFVDGNDLIHIYDNPASCCFLDVEASMIAGRRASDLNLAPEVLAQWIDRYRECERTGQPVHFEYEHQTSRGLRWLSAVVSRIGGASSESSRFCYIAEDVTERRRLTQQLDSERSLLNAFFASSTMALGLVDTQFRYLRVNQALAETNGVELENHFGCKISDVLPELWPTIEPFMRKVLDTGEAIRDLEVDGTTSKRLDHPQSWLVSYYPVRVGEQIVGIGFALVETTQARQRELLLREAEERFRASQEASLDGFAILRSRRDESNKIVDFEWVYVNPAATEMMGRSIEGLIGHELHDLRPAGENDPGLFAAYVNVVESGRPHDIEIPFESDGETRWFRNMTVRLGDGIAVSFCEITDRLRAEQELRQADRRKDEFLAMLAHELRNPLAPIRNALTVMATAENERATQVWSRQVIDRQVRHLTRLVDDLLDVSRINQGKITLSMAPTAVSEFISAAVESSRPLIEKYKHAFSLGLPEETLWVQGDLTRLAQIVTNLLNNAAKYTPDGGQIRLSVESDEGWVVIRVRDNGEGLSPEMLPRVFELFAQASRSLDRTQGGLGIGLTLVKRLVEMHGGAISVQSEGTAQGSEFVVRLPGLEHTHSAVIASPLNGLSGPLPTLSRRILVVDDSQDSSATLSRILQRLGHVVATVEDGPSACDAALRFHPDLVLLDIGLPGMDGYEVARRMRAESSLNGMTLVALTGYGSEADRLQSRSAGFDVHLVKPVEIEALNTILQGLQSR